MPLTARPAPAPFHSPPARRRETATAILTVMGLGLGLGLGTQAALAQEVTISDDRDSAFSTSTIDNGAAADVSIEDGVTVSVGSGTAATLDSSNSITNEGTITSKATSDATGLHIATGSAGQTITGGLTQNGTINAGALDKDDNPGSGNTAILIDGDGTFVGDIVSDNSASVTAVGTESYGFSLRSSMQGDVTLRSVGAAGDRSTAISVSGTLDGDLSTTGPVSATGSEGTALSVDGLVTGGITNSGSMTTGTARSVDRKGNIIDAVPGIATVQIGGQVEGGLLNDLHYVDGDGNITQTADDPDATYTTVTGSIAATGGAPAVKVSPTGNGDANVGAYDSSGFGIINEGKISANGQNPGTATSTILIEGATVNGTTHDAVITGGILNRSTGSITAAAVDADAVAIEVGAGGQVPAITNAGSIEATIGVATDQNGNLIGPGGDAYGILVDEGASVSSVTNNGKITATANGEDTSAYGIVDRAGGLTSITNSGVITPTIADGGTGRTIAIDLSANTSGASVVNSGTITGDILYGGGSDRLGITGGAVTGAVDFGAGANSMTLSGKGAFTGTMAATGGTASLDMKGSSTFRLTGSNTLELSSLTVADGAKLYVPAAIGRTSVSVSGNAVFSGSKSLVPVFTNIIEDQGDVTLVSAGALTVADPGNLIAITDLPYFYTIEGQFVTATSAGLTLKRKTAADLGLSDNEATLYEHSIAALNSDEALATAVGNITSAEGFNDAYRQMQPAGYGSAVAAAALRHDDLAFGMIANRLDAMRDTLKLADARINRTGFWAQEAAVFYDKTETVNDPGFDGHTISFALGYDKEMLGLDTMGIALTQGWSTLDKDLANGRPLSVSQTQVDIYGAWSSGPFFIHGLAAAAYNGYKSERELVIGEFERTSSAHWHGTQFSGNLRAGYEIPLGAFLLTPSNSVSYLKLKQNSYEETGGGGMDLAVSSSSFSSLRNSARLALAYYSKLEDDSYFKAQLNTGWIHSLHMDGLETTGHFTADPDDSFTLVTDPMDKDTLAAGLSLAYVSGSSTLSVSYDYGHSDTLSSHAASITWYMRF